MSKTTIDSSVLEQLGVKNWHMHTQFEHASPIENKVDLSQKGLVPVEDSPLQAPAHEKMITDVPHVASEQADYLVEAKPVEEVDFIESSQLVDKTALVFVGKGLEQVWHNEESTEWGLMLNILSALKTQQEEVVYFDTALFHTEDAIMMTLEEIIDTGVELVFSFDEDSSLNEALSEGLHVEILPSLEEMLAQSYAKKQVYYRLVNYVN